MKVFFIFILLIILQGYVFAGNRIPIPSQQISYSKADIITNPINGEKFVHNQLLVVFEPTVQKQQQKEVLKSIKGKVVGGLPAFDIYQITFDNDDRSFSKLAQIQLQLEKNENVVFAMPKNVEQPKPDKTRDLIASVSFQRTGELTSQKLHRKSSTNFNGIQSAINGHWQGLNACVEKRNRVADIYHGKINFVITVSPEGNVKYARVSSTNIRDKQVTICMLQKIRKWRDFPPVKGNEDRRVEFEFVF